MIQLHNADCLEVMDSMEKDSIDLILCDLPYGTTACKWDSIIPFKKLWEQYNRIIKDNGAVVLFAAQPFTTKLIESNLRNFKYCWYWKKNNATGFCYAKYQPMRKIEDICVFYKKQPVYNPQGLKRIENPKTEKKPNRGGSGGSGVYRSTFNKPYTPKFTNYPKNVLEFMGVTNNERYHPTQKPVPLLEYLVKTYTNEGDIVLDNCMGSGSTGVACVNTGRKFRGIELEEKYFNIARNRIKRAKEDLNERTDN